MTLSRSNRAQLLGLCALLAAGVACGDGAGGSKADAPEAQAGIVTTTSTPSADKGTAKADDLARALVVSVPAGYELAPDDVGDTGPSDLEKAVRDDGEADAREVLTKDGFIRGYQRMWLNQDEDEIIVFLYRFADHAGALHYTQRTIEGTQGGDEGLEITPFDVSGIEGAVGTTASDGDFASSVVNFVKGTYGVTLVVNGTTPAGQADLVRRLARDQFDRL